VNDKNSKRVYNTFKKGIFMGYKLEIIQMLLKRPSLSFRKHIKKEKIDNQIIQYAQIDNEATTVVFEHGMNAGMKFWDKIFLEIGKTNSVFVYNRNDKKDAENKKVYTNRVELLRKLLIKRGLKPPYILVGHSLGGTYIQYFAKKYPSEVLGIVIVDTPKPGALDDVSMFPKMLLKLYTTIFKEINQVDQEILSLPPIDIEVSIIVATLKRFTTQYKKYIPMTNMLHEKAKEYSTLYPHCKIQWVDTGHVVMLEKPEVVSNAIKDMINNISKNEALK